MLATCMDLKRKHILLLVLMVAEMRNGRDLVEEYDDDRDPLDTLGSSRPGTATRLPVIRFAPQQIEPMAPLMEVQE